MRGRLPPSALGDLRDDYGRGRGRARGGGVLMSCHLRLLPSFPSLPVAAVALSILRSPLTRQGRLRKAPRVNEPGRPRAAADFRFSMRAALAGMKRRADFARGVATALGRRAAAAVHGDI